MVDAILQDPADLGQRVGSVYKLTHLTWSQRWTCSRLVLAEDFQCFQRSPTDKLGFYRCLRGSKSVSIDQLLAFSTGQERQAWAIDEAVPRFLPGLLRTLNAWADTDICPVASAITNLDFAEKCM